MINRIITDISDFIFVCDEPKKVDVIFIPGGSYAELPAYAAKLYRQGYAKRIVPSGGVAKDFGCFSGPKSKMDVYIGDYQTECDFFIDVLEKNGVPKETIVKEDKAAFTKENAILSRKVIDEKGIKVESALIVCKAFHARRCLMLYQMAFPEVTFSICPVHCYNITHDNWFTTEKGIERVMGEIARCGNQLTDEIKDYLLVNRTMDCEQ